MGLPHTACALLVEGLDLRELADTSGSGVYQVNWGAGLAFETERAKAIGETVYREFHELSDDLDACGDVRPEPG